MANNLIPTYVLTGACTQLKAESSNSHTHTHTQMICTARDQGSSMVPHDSISDLGVMDLKTL